MDEDAIFLLSSIYYTKAFANYSLEVLYTQEVINPPSWAPNELLFTLPILFFFTRTGIKEIVAQYAYCMYIQCLLRRRLIYVHCKYGGKEFLVQNEFMHIHKKLLW
jgi:hypothetical protein